MGTGSEAYPGGERYKHAARLISEYQDRAFRQVRSEYPALDAELRGEKFDKKKALHAPPTTQAKPQFISQ
jgi:hypothetical protein